MAIYDVYLEINEAGNCFAHVPALPGCVVRAKDQETAVASLPDAVRKHIDWLLERGLLEEGPDGFELNIVETHERSGAFNPDDFTALLSFDREPLSQVELNNYLDLVVENRADLRRLAHHLPDEILDWKARKEWMSIRGILRHIASGEQWYVSRVVDPATLPERWAEPEPESVWEYLEMVRQTAVQRLQQLSDEEMMAVYTPTYDTSRPEVEWTVRKSLRRLLEHEREHLVHIREILADWRRHYMVRLTAERAEMIWQLTRFSEQTLSEVPVFENYTAKDLLAHIPAWDDYHTERISLALAGRESEIIRVDSSQRNEELYPARKDWSLSEAVDSCLGARRRFEETIAQVPDRIFHQPFTMPWGSDWSIRDSAEWRYWHDATHTADLEKWREANKELFAIGTQSVLLAAMDTAHDEMLAVVAIVPEHERETRLVCGDWTLKDVLGHVADWEWFGVEKWRPEQSNRSLQIAYPGSIQEWNDLHAAARKEDSWERIWLDYVNARSTLRQILEGLSDDDLAKVDPAPWNPKDTIYRWIYTWIHHEREHAADLRLVLNLPDFPERLTHA